jgi:phospholipid/cholesterol/gamma-HCH transport system substrate-binding protein
MSRTTLDLWVGFFVALGFAALIFLALKVGNLSTTEAGQTYVVHAKFDNVGGLKVRGAVKSSGVVVGRVTDIHFDTQSYLAEVTMAVNGHYHFPKDTFATINTSGLLGEQYVGFEVGGDSAMLEPGETIKKTQSAVVLEKLISQFMFSKASDASAANN